MAGPNEDHPTTTPTPPGDQQPAPERGSKGDWREFLSHGIWQHEALEGTLAHRYAIALLRLLSIVRDGLMQNRLLNRAAALSYASLIGIGPLIAIIVFVSGSFLRTDAETQIKRALFFVAPTLTEYTEIDAAIAAEGGESAAPATSQIDDLIRQIVAGAERIIEGIDTRGSHLFGIIGVGTLVFVAIQLLTSIETTFNIIWGVRQGRSWMQRIVFYWTFITLGAVLGIGAAALFSASSISRLSEWAPLGLDMSGMLGALSPYLSLMMIALLLTFAYSFFPNTSVSLRAAVIGSIIVALLLTANNYLSVLYVNRVLTLKNLYGSVGIVPVLLVGLYFFWVLVLLGGQLTYAIQNFHLVAHQHAWSRLSHHSRESLALAALIEICRRFLLCQPPLSAHELADRVGAPANLLNESLGILIDIGWVKGFRDRAPSGTEENLYLPARPLETITLADFQRAMSESGEHIRPGAGRNIDPVLAHYWDTRDRGLTEAFAEENFETLLQRTLR